MTAEPIPAAGDELRHGLQSPARKRDAYLKVRAAAARVLLDQGYGDASLQDIADIVGIPKGSVHYQIGSKEEMLWEIVYDGMGRLLGELEKVVKYPLPVADRLRLAIRLSTVLLSERDDAAVAGTLTGDMRFLSTEHREQYLDMRDRYQALFVGLLEEGAESGAFRKLENAKIVTFGYFGMGAYMRTWYRPGGGLTPDEIADIWWDFFMKALDPR